MTQTNLSTQSHVRDQIELQESSEGTISPFGQNQETLQQSNRPPTHRCDGSLERQ